jgi:hypothetical protein
VCFPSSTPRKNGGSSAPQVCSAQITGPGLIIILYLTTGDSTVRVSAPAPLSVSDCHWLASRNRFGVPRSSLQSTLSTLFSTQILVTFSPSLGLQHIPRSTLDVKTPLYSGTTSLASIRTLKGHQQPPVHVHRDVHTNSLTATLDRSDGPLI